VPESLNARFVGNWPFGFGYTLTLDTSRKIAFVSSGGGVFILDIIRPQAPVKLGEIRCRGIVEQLKYQDSILYLIHQWHSDGVELWDVSEPFRPVRLATISIRYTAALDVRSRYLYVGDADSFRVFDILNPARPIELGSCGGYDAVSFVTVTDSFAFIALGAFPGRDTGFRIINIQNPANPYEIGRWDRLFVNGLAVADGYAYCVTDNGLQVINIANPAQPYEVGFCSTLGFSPQRIAVRDSYAYVADDNAGLTIVDVRNPANPFVAANLRRVVHNVETDVALMDSFACLANWCSYPGFWIVSINNPLAPFEAGSYGLPGWSFAVALAGDYAYLAEWDAGLRILNIADPAYPYEMGTFFTEWGSGGVALRDSLAYLTSLGKGLWILNISCPSRPVALGFCSTPGGAEAVAVKDSYALVADGMSGLRVINVADPRHPYEVGYYDTPGYARFVATCDSLAYVADEGGGLRIISIQNPSQPSEVGAVLLSNYPVVLQVKDSIAYLGGYNGDVVIVNVRDPSQPYPVGLYPTLGPCWGVDVSYPYAYVSDWFPGLFHIVDIRDPSNPFQAGYYYTPNCPYGLVFSSPYVYVTTSLCGLQIYESLLAGVEEKCQPERVQTEPRVLEIYPNPATAAFIVRLNHRILSGTRLPILRIYDATGRVIRSEELRDKSRPEYPVSLDGIADGVYFVGLAGEGPMAKLVVKGKPGR